MVAESGLLFVGKVLAQPSVDDVGGAVDTSQVTGWALLAAVIVLIAAYPIGRLAQRLVKRAFRKAPGVSPEIIYDLSRGTRYLIYLSAVGIALVLVGVGSSWIAIVVVVVLLVGVLIARPQIENTSAGLVLTVRPSFHVGDQIEVMDTVGTVLQIGSHSTVLESVDGVRSYIPNTSMLGEMVHVYTATDARRTQFQLSLASGTDIGTAVEIISKSLAATDGILPDPAPEVLASQLDEDAMIISARFWYSSNIKTDSVPISSAMFAVRKSLDAAGIELGGATTAIDETNEPPAPDKASPT